MDRRGALYLALVVATIGAYLPVLRNEFVLYDDPLYVTENAHVSRGLSVPGVAWALTATEASNWHPVTWISHQLDCTLFGLEPAGHHATSVLLHAVSACLLFRFLAEATRRPWTGLAVAALWAVHPLTVSSVAWVAERKNVLAGLWFLVTLNLYVAFAHTKRRHFWYLALAALAAGLASKPTVVTLPFLLLVLDVWPLKRYPDETFRALFVEKIPAFVLAALSCLVTVSVQHGAGAVGSLVRFPLSLRIGNAIVSTVRYMLSAFGLEPTAVFHPYPDAWVTPLGVGLCAAVVFGLLALACRHRETHPAALTGVLWFYGCLVPMSGLVQVGIASRADRHAYLPIIGFLVAVVYVVGDLVRRWPSTERVVQGCVVVIVLTMGLTTTRNVLVWRSSETLFRHCLQVTADNVVARNNLGYALLRQGRFHAAVEQFEAANALEDGHAAVHANLGLARWRCGAVLEAEWSFRRALTLDPNRWPTYDTFGRFLEERGRPEEARLCFERAVQLSKTDPGPAMSLGRLHLSRGRLRSAAESFILAIARDPFSGDAHNALGVVLARAGQRERAREHFLLALRYQPALQEARDNLRLLDGKKQTGP